MFAMTKIAVGLVLAAAATGAQAVAVSSISVTGGDFGMGSPAPADCHGSTYSSYQCITGTPTYSAGDGMSSATPETLMFNFFGCCMFARMAPSAPGAPNAKDWADGFQGAVDLSTGTIELNMGGFYVKFNGNNYLQGTDSTGANGTSTLATGTVSGNTFDVSWHSYFDGAGSLNGNTGYWHITGTYTAAVPEAETYAMMLAGLGLVGFVAHRRRKLL